MTLCYDLTLVAYISIHNRLPYNDIYLRHPLIKFYQIFVNSPLGLSVCILTIGWANKRFCHFRISCQDEVIRTLIGQQVSGVHSGGNLSGGGLQQA
jgi:hypothetical protein